MKIFITLLLIIFSWYFAGIYQQLPMMVLLIMELIFLVIMCVMPYYCRRKIDIRFTEQNIATRKGSELSCNIRTDNRGKLPVNRLKIKMRFKYPCDKKMSVRKRLYGCAEQGKNDDLEFIFLAPYCGSVIVEVMYVRLYDYLSIFSAKKRIRAEMKIAVLPQERALHIKIPSLEQYEGNPKSEQFIIQNGDDHSEIRQLREYREGDSNRFVHWNYSARTGALWIKEYEKESDFCFELILDTAVSQQPTAAEWDLFYELLSAVVLGLLQNNAVVRLHWYDRKLNGFNIMDIENAEQCSETLTRLYNTEIISTNEKISQHILTMNKGFMKLNFNLEWYFNEKLIYVFSPTNIDKEITDRTFIV